MSEIIRLDKRERTFDEIRIYLFHDACESGQHIEQKYTEGKGSRSRTSFPFGECYVTSRFILNKLDLNLPPSCLLVLWFLLLVIIVSTTLGCILIVDEAIFWNTCLYWLR